jgi:hypothetical protein
MTNIVNRMPYLRTSREFPEDLHQISIEMNKSWVDIANAVNERTIGIFPTVFPALTGESWFIDNNRKQQTFRRVYTFTSTASINHGITVIDPNQFTRCWGNYTDGTNSFGIIWATTMAILGQITFDITSTQIVFNVGAGAPALTKGRVTLEWLSSV